jgi:hypothetical protein
MSEKKGKPRGRNGGRKPLTVAEPVVDWKIRLPASHKSAIQEHRLHGEIRKAIARIVKKRTV